MERGVAIVRNICGGLWPSSRAFVLSVLVLALFLASADLAFAQTNPEGGVISGTLSIIGNVLGTIITPIALFILTLSSMILGVVGVLFNWAVIRTVFEFGTYFGNSTGMLIAWGIMRDVGNIVLLFGFIFMGIATILNTHSMDEYSAKKALPRLIIFAILLNFSLFAAQAVIDTANAFGSVFVTQAGIQCDSSATAAAGTAADCASNGIAGHVLQIAGVASVWDAAVLMAPSKMATVFVLLSVFVAITAVVLLAAAIMLITRAVILMFLMITSPIGFAGMAIPPLQGLARRWWSTLISQAFYAPVFLLLILISLKVADGLAGGGKGNTLVKAFAGQGLESSNNLQAVLVFAVVIGLMIASMVVARRLGAYGAGFAANTASAIVFGGMTRASNVGLGLAGSSMRRLSRQGLAPGETPKGVRRLALQASGKFLQNTNFDVRRVPGTAGLLGAAGITAGAKPADHATFADYQHRLDDARSGKTMAKIADQATRDIKEKMLEDEAHHGELSDPSKVLLTSYTTKQLEALHGIQEGVAAMAQNLTPDQFKSLMKSDNLTSAQKEKLAKGRFANLAADIKAAEDSSLSEEDQKKARDAVEKKIKNINKSDFEYMENSLVTNRVVLDALTDKQRDGITDNDRIADTVKELVKDSSKHRKVEIALKTAIDNNDTASVNSILGSSFRSIKAEKIAEFDGDILAHPLVAKALNAQVLGKIQRDGKHNNETTEKITRSVENDPNAVGYDYITGTAAGWWGAKPKGKKNQNP